MALLFQELKDGIQLGKETDKCIFCEKEYLAKRETLREGLLTNKEVFLLNLNGTRKCICMDHFQGLLGQYVLIDSNDLTEDEVLTLDGETLEKCETKEEVEKHIEEQLAKEAAKNDTKKAKTSKSNKGK